MIFYSDHTLFTGIFGESVIGKQSENNHFKVLCVKVDVMSGNLQNIGVKQLKPTTSWVICPPKSLTRGAF